MVRLILQDLWLWLTGWPKLWTGQPHGRGPVKLAIEFQPGWGPWRFALPYASTYLAGCLCGYGVVSLSRAWYERSHNPRFRFARFMTRLLDWLVPGQHGAHTGPWLWASASRRNISF